MKKIISLLGSLALAGTTGISVVSCQKNEVKSIFPFPEMPEALDEVQYQIGYYWDLYKFYSNEYWEKEYPERIKFIDSENWQKMYISNEIASTYFEFIGYQLGQDGGFHFKTEKDNDYNGDETDKESLSSSYDRTMKDVDVTIWAKDEITRWYNWALTMPINVFKTKYLPIMDAEQSTQWTITENTDKVEYQKQLNKCIKRLDEISKEPITQRENIKVTLTLLKIM